MRSPTILASSALLILFAVPLAESLRAEDAMYAPRFSAAKELLRPENYREWMFVGSSLGMGYREDAASSNPKFHNVYIQREAFRRYAATGEFPDKTMLVMEVVSAGFNASINRQGKFEDGFVGIEVALKDEARFPEKWAYFNFIGSNGDALASAKPFPKEACWSCHNQHAAADNVFVQFYPVLKSARK
jgi:hypothetical protein